LFVSFSRDSNQTDEESWVPARRGCAVTGRSLQGKKSPAVLPEAAGLLERASILPGGAWVLVYEAYLSLAEAWLAHGEPDRARVVLAPLLAVADREPWTLVLATALVADGRALIRLAGRHGLPHVLRNVREARQQLG
jgi:hypothetical protein